MFWHYFRAVYLRQGGRLVRRGIWWGAGQPLPCILLSIWDGHKKKRPYLYMKICLDLCREICIFYACAAVLNCFGYRRDLDLSIPSAILSVCHLSTTSLRRQLFGAKHKIALMQAAPAAAKQPI